MKNIYYFFRSATDKNNFITFGKLHLLILFIALFVSIFIFIMKTKNRILELFIGSTLIIQQVILYTWYFISKYNLLKEGLPLFHCRIAIIFVGIGLIFNRKPLMKIGSYWGIFGSISALLLPGIDPFSFPHITQFSYFIGHLFLLWGSIYLLRVKKIGMSEIDLKNLLLFTTAYHLLMLMINTILNSNYAYMNAPPFYIGDRLNPLIYSLTVIMIFNIVLCIEYFFINKNAVVNEDCETQYS